MDGEESLKFRRKIELMALLATAGGRGRRDGRWRERYVSDSGELYVRG